MKNQAKNSKNQSTLLIAIDGPSSSGKGTIAKKIASHFNLPCLNTGALYRAIAFIAQEQGLNLAVAEEKIIQLCDNLTEIDLESPLLHNEKIGKAASIIAANFKIRQAMFDFQRNFALAGLQNKGGAVLEGRDIGTVICPDANYKFFITASAKVRAQRRLKQLQATEPNQIINQQIVLEQITSRDFQDQNRLISPLKKAEDAIEIDNSQMNVEEVFQKILGLIRFSV